MPRREIGFITSVAPAGVTAAIVVLLVVAVASLSGRRDEPLPIVDHPTVPLPAPGGVAAKPVRPAGLGVTLQLPASWQESAPRSGFEHEFGDGNDAYFLSVRVATVDDIEADRFATLSRDLLDSIGADIDSIATTTVDRHGAVVVQGRLPKSARVEHETVFTELDIDLGDGTWAVVVVGERPPADQRAVREWIASTIDVDAEPPWDPDLTHPATELAPPPGVEVREFAPAGLGVSIKVPATWTEPDDAPAGFDEGIRAPSGPSAFLLASRVTQGRGSPSNRETMLVRFGARMIATSDELVGGHPARVLRYRIGQFDSDGLGVIDTEYVIDLGNGDFVWLVIGTRGGAPRELLEWIRSTIHVVE